MAEYTVYFNGDISVEYDNLNNWELVGGAAPVAIPGSDANTWHLIFQWALPAGGNPSNALTGAAAAARSVLSIASDAGDYGVNLASVNLTNVTIANNSTVNSLVITGGTFEGNLIMADAAGPANTLDGTTVEGDLTIGGNAQGTINDITVDGSATLSNCSIDDVASTFSGPAILQGSCDLLDASTFADTLRLDQMNSMAGFAGTVAGITTVDGGNFDGGTYSKTVNLVDDGVTVGGATAPICNAIVNDESGSQVDDIDCDAAGSVYNMRHANGQIIGGAFKIINIMADVSLTSVTSVSTAVRIYSVCDIASAFRAAGDVFHLMTKQVSGMDDGAGKYLPNASQIPVGAVPVFGVNA